MQTLPCDWDVIHLFLYAAFWEKLTAHQRNARLLNIPARERFQVWTLWGFISYHLTNCWPRSEHLATSCLISWSQTHSLHNSVILCLLAWAAVVSHSVYLKRTERLRADLVFPGCVWVHLLRVRRRRSQSRVPSVAAAPVLQDPALISSRWRWCRFTADLFTGQSCRDNQTTWGLGSASWSCLTQFSLSRQACWTTPTPSNPPLPQALP